MAKVRNLPPSGNAKNEAMQAWIYPNKKTGNAKNEAMQAWNMQFPTSSGGTFGGIKIPPQGNPNAAIDTITLRGIHGEIKNLNMGIAGLSQGIQSLVELQEKSIIADKKEDKDKARALAKANAKNIENERESRLGKLGGSLKEGAKAVGNTASGVVKNSTVGGFLSTLIGGAILLAIFAPDKAKKMMTALQKGFSELMDSKFYEKVEKAAKGIFDEFSWDNLVVSGILGWRIGAIYSGLKYVGSLVKTWLGISSGTGNATELDPEGDGKINPKDKTWIDENFEKVFAGVGVAAILMPSAVFGLIKAMVGAVSSLIFGGLGLLTGPGAASALPAGVAKDIDDTKKSTKKSIFGKAAGKGIKAFGILGLIGAATMLAVDFMEDGDIDDTGALALGIASAVATFAPAFTASLIGRFFSPAGLLVGALAGLVGAVYLATKGARDALDEAIRNLEAGGPGSVARADKMFGNDARAGSRAAEIKGVTVAEGQRLNQAGQGTGKEAQLQGEFIEDINTLKGKSMRPSKGTKSEVATLLIGRLGQIRHLSGGMIAALVDYAESTGHDFWGANKYTITKIADMISDRSGREKFLKEANARRSAFIKKSSIPDSLAEMEDFEYTPPKTIDPEIATVSPIAAKAKRKLAALNVVDDGWGEAMRTEGELTIAALKAKAQGSGPSLWDSAKATMARQNLNNDDVMGDTLETPEGVAKYLSDDNTNKNATKEVMKSSTTVGWIQRLGNWLANVPTPPNLAPVDNPIADLVGSASASQSSAAKDVIVMGSGTQTAGAASGTTVNNNTVKSDSNINLYSMNEENRAAYAHLTRFGALG